MSRVLTAALLAAALVATTPAPAGAQPEDPVVQLLEALTNAPGPSGFEGPVQVCGRDTIFIDVGATSQADAERMGIRPGDPIAPWSPFTVLANDRYAAKAWDDPVFFDVELSR